MQNVHLRHLERTDADAGSRRPKSKPSYVSATSIPKPAYFDVFQISETLTRSVSRAMTASLKLQPLLLITGTTLKSRILWADVGVRGIRLRGLGGLVPN